MAWSLLPEVCCAAESWPRIRRRAFKEACHLAECIQYVFLFGGLHLLLIEDLSGAAAGGPEFQYILASDGCN